MTGTGDRFGPPPRPEAEILAELDRMERRHDGPCDRGRLLAEMARRRRWERDRSWAVLLRADALRYETVRAEHLRWLRISVRQLRAALRLPDSPGREHRIAFARDAVRHNKESVRIWTKKVADAQAKLRRARFWIAAE
jgi:hypothetical protein